MTLQKLFNCMTLQTNITSYSSLTRDLAPCYDVLLLRGAFIRVEMLLMLAFTADTIADQQSLVFSLTLDAALKRTAL